MILGIDASQANRKIRSGTEWYAFYLIEEFKKLIGGRKDIEVRLYLRDELREDLAKNLPENFQPKILRWPVKYFWGQVRLSWEMLFHPPDILFCPAHTIPLIHPRSPLPTPPHQGEGNIGGDPFPPGGGEGEGASFSPMTRGRLRGGRTFTTLHDIGFEDNPELYDKLSLWYHKFSAWFAVKKASHIFTISEYSKKRIVEAYRADPSKITVIYLGCDLSRPSVTLPTPGEGLGGDYILFVGRLEPKKNILGMVKAYEKFLSFPRRRESNPLLIDKELGSGSEAGMTEKEAPDLVLAGRKVRITNVEEYLAARPELAKRIKFIGYIENQDLAALYAGAVIFLFPTFYEGFGLPIIEAQACGTPVITSNITSNPEIAGDGAIIVDPRNIDQIAGAIQNVLTDENLRNQIIQKGLENIKRFNWERTARETLNVMLVPIPPPREGEKKRGS